MRPVLAYITSTAECETCITRLSHDVKPTHQVSFPAGDSFHCHSLCNYSCDDECLYVQDYLYSMFGKLAMYTDLYKLYRHPF